MKTKTLFLSLFSLCFFFAFPSTPAQAADDWGGYKLIGKNRAVSIYAKVDNTRDSDGDKRANVWWRVVNHTDQWLSVSFKPVYHFDNGKNRTGFKSEKITPNNPSSYFGVYDTGPFMDAHVRGIEIFELNIDEYNPL